MKKILMSIIVLSMLAMSAMCLAGEASSATPSVDASAVATTATIALPSVSATGDLADVAGLCSSLYKNWKVLGVWGISSMIVIILLSLLNSGLIAGIKGFTVEYKRLTNLILSAILSVTSTVYMGGSWSTALIATLVTSSGAVAIYEALKGAGIIKSKKTA